MELPWLGYCAGSSLCQLGPSTGDPPTPGPGVAVEAGGGRGGHIHPGGLHCR